MRVYSEDEKCVTMKKNIKILNQRIFIAEIAKNTGRYMIISMMKFSAVIVERSYAEITFG